MNYVFLGSLGFQQDNSANSQKLQVDIIGGGWGANDKGTTTFYIANRGGLSVNQVTQGGSSFTASRLKIYQNGSTTSFYLAVNSANEYLAFAVKAYLFGYATTAQQVSIATQTTVPTGTDITSSITVTPVLITDLNGNIGLNTSSPDPAYRLSVNGKIRAKEIRVETGWADYVFDKSYELPSLTDIKTYIDQNHHLPEIPSEQEVAKNGINLGEMNKLLLKKVEELTLYLIEKDNELTTEKAVNRSQEKQLTAFKDRLDNLEKQKTTNINK
ncbi:hypothetical protein [Mucilaginibacter ginsenosidivorax]|uniref:Uncharacterized protein n=1 Tax=Mucilaginibacter ginsenosidivorax TaxID=862126 RepID=A0A5B8W8N2_9SPHI|nr:hypothetical protein [Mucilaginibacter ginsenosidivorax]QEC79315.1 hypothetical protein FSB76_26440 [Mucilaginibacter ginsenosidivorax]